MGEVGHLQLGSVDVSDRASNVSKSSCKEMNDDAIQVEKKKKIELCVPFYKLFSFADKYDYLLMFVGTIGAIIHGAAMPVFFVFFGELINGFGKKQRNPAKMVDEVSKYALNFLYLGLVILGSSCLHDHMIDIQEPRSLCKCRELCRTCILLRFLDRVFLKAVQTRTRTDQFNH